MMEFTIEKSFPVLDRTPAVLKTLLAGLDEKWIMGNEGPDTFSPYDVVGHLIYGEKTDWAVRVKIILGSGTSKAFTPYDRFAMYRDSKDKSLARLLDEFEELRRDNMTWIRGLKIGAADLEKKGLHPVFGEVTLGQLLSAWVVHDLTHIAQITRVMSKQYKKEIGPWVEFFRILNF